MSVIKPLSLRDELQEIRETSSLQGKYVGFEATRDLFTLKKGYPFYIAGLPYSGKSRWLFEMLINTSCYYGWKHFVFSPETGNAEDITILLMQMKAEKQFRKYYAEGKESKYAMSDDEFDYCLKWVNEYFVIMDIEKLEIDMTIEDFYMYVERYSKQEKISFDTTTIDPWIEMSYDLSEYGGREDLYLKKALNIVRRDAKNNERINFIINHVGSTKRMMQDGKQYEPIPHPNQWAGGTMWFRKAYTMLTVYRPDAEYYQEKVDFNIEKNETWLIVNKAKPDGVGRIGQARMFYDLHKGRYYEMDNFGNHNYSSRPEDEPSIPLQIEAPF